MMDALVAEATGSIDTTVEAPTEAGETNAAAAESTPAVNTETTDVVEQLIVDHSADQNQANIDVDVVQNQPLDGTDNNQSTTEKVNVENLQPNIEDVVEHEILSEHQQNDTATDEQFVEQATVEAAQNTVFESTEASTIEQQQQHEIPQEEQQLPQQQLPQQQLPQDEPQQHQQEQQVQQQQEQQAQQPQEQQPAPAYGIYIDGNARATFNEESIRKHAEQIALLNYSFDLGDGTPAFVVGYQEVNGAWFLNLRNEQGVEGQIRAECIVITPLANNIITEETVPMQVVTTGDVEGQANLISTAAGNLAPTYVQISSDIFMPVDAANVVVEEVIATESTHSNHEIDMCVVDHHEVVSGEHPTPMAVEEVVSADQQQNNSQLQPEKTTVVAQPETDNPKSDQATAEASVTNDNNNSTIPEISLGKSDHRISNGKPEPVLNKLKQTLKQNEIFNAFTSSNSNLSTSSKTYSKRNIVWFTMSEEEQKKKVEESKSKMPRLLTTIIEKSTDPLPEKIMEDDDNDDNDEDLDLNITNNSIQIFDKKKVDKAALAAGIIVQKPGPSNIKVIPITNHNQSQPKTMRIGTTRSSLQASTSALNQPRRTTPSAGVIVKMTPVVTQKVDSKVIIKPSAKSINSSTTPSGYKFTIDSNKIVINKTSPVKKAEPESPVKPREPQPKKAKTTKPSELELDPVSEEIPWIIQRRLVRANAKTTYGNRSSNKKVISCCEHFDFKKTAPPEPKPKPWLGITERREKCNFCDYKLSNKCEVHIRIQGISAEKVDVNKTKIICSQCKEIFFSKKPLFYHLATCKDSYQPRPPPPPSIKPSLPSSVGKRGGGEDDDDADVEEKLGKAVNKKLKTEEPKESDLELEDSHEEEEEEKEADPELNGFKAHDIVWVKVKPNRHWPVYVLKVLPEINKLQVKLINYPWKRNEFNVNPKTVLPFDNPYQNSCFLSAWKKENYESPLLITLRYCEIYHRKRLLGDEFNFQFENIETFVTPKATVNSEAGTSSSSSPGNSQNVTNSLGEESKSGAEHKDDNVASNGSADGHQTQPPPAKPDLSNLKVDCTKVIRFIKESRVDHFLIGIYRGTFNCARHRAFMAKKTETDSDDLGDEIPFGPITDEEMQDELTDYCRALFEANFDKEKFPGYRAYVYSVWIPEAIIKAINRVYRVDLEGAAAIFNRYAQEMRDKKKVEDQAENKKKSDAQEYDDDSISISDDEDKTRKWQKKMKMAPRTSSNGGDEDVE